MRKNKENFKIELTKKKKEMNILWNGDVKKGREQQNGDKQIGIKMKQRTNYVCNIGTWHSRDLRKNYNNFKSVVAFDLRITSLQTCFFLTWSLWSSYCIP